MIRAKAGVRDTQRPVASFLFLGTTGVGKTELAKVLTTQIYGKTSEMRRFDMSEYREKHNVARLIGSPPGYIGSEQGGQLTELVKKYPNSIFLFDEVEKAHQDIFNIFLQILDEGRLTDSKGETVDFTKAVVILTSNLGAKNMLYGVEKGELTSSAKKSVLREVSNFFKPEFINRLDELIYFLPLQRENV